VDDQDFTVLEVEGFDLCTVGPMDSVRMKVQHLGCDSTGPVSLVFTLIKSNPTLIWNDTLDLPEGVGPGEVFEYEFSRTFDFSRTGLHQLTGRVSSAGDLNKENDNSPTSEVYNLLPVSNQDFPFHSRIAFRTFRDSIAFYSGEFAHLLVWFNAGRDSTYGIRIEGDRARYGRPVYEGQDVFDLNHRLGTQICFCVDAVNLDSLGFQFDLRQTYTSSLDTIIGVPYAKTSAVRVMIDTTELGRFFPETNQDDEWQTHHFDLEDFLGSEFELCFETRTIQSLVEDDDSIGDRVFLDNIRFIGREVSAAIFSAAEVQPLVVYPNPVSETLHVIIPSSHRTSATLHLRDLTGRSVTMQPLELLSGENTLSLEVQGITSGIYFVEANADGERMLAKVVIE
jgi:hypothetical protein